MPGINPSVGEIDEMFADPSAVVHVNDVLTTLASSIFLSDTSRVFDFMVVVTPFTTKSPLTVRSVLTVRSLLTVTSKLESPLSQNSVPDPITSCLSPEGFNGE